MFTAASSLPCACAWLRGRGLTFSPSASRPLTINVVLPVWHVSWSLRVFLALCPSSTPISSSYPFMHSSHIGRLLQRSSLGLHAMVPNAKESGQAAVAFQAISILGRGELSVPADRRLRIGVDTFIEGRSRCAALILSGRAARRDRSRRSPLRPQHSTPAMLTARSASPRLSSTPSGELFENNALRTGSASGDDRWLVRVTRTVAASLFGSRPCQPPPYVYISPTSPTPSPHRIPRPPPHSRHRTPNLNSLTPSCMLRHLFHPSRPP